MLETAYKEQFYNLASHDAQEKYCMHAAKLCSVLKVSQAYFPTFTHLVKFASLSSI